MTAIALAVVPRNRAVQYDGTNSAEIDALISDFTIVSESGSSITIESGGGTHVCPVDGFFLFNESGQVFDIVNNEVTFGERFHVLALADDVTEVMTQLDALPAVVGAAGATTFAGLISLGTVTVPVQITPAMPDTNYTPEATVFGGVGILGNVNILSVAVVDTDTVNVQIQNTSLSLLGGTIMVVAVA